jgi:phosphomannomutase/phosphoglucomutase
MSSVWSPELFEFSPTPFKAYDIRGNVPGEIDAAFAHALGMAYGERAARQGARAVVVGRDARMSSVELAAALQAGIRAAGMTVIDIGMATTPMVWFAARLTETGAAVAVTGSHNADGQNGFKLMLGGAILHGEELRQLQREMEVPNHALSAAGQRMQLEIASCYGARLLSDVRLDRSMKIAIDCGHGVAGAFAPGLFTELGCEVTQLFCEVNGSFPVHRPQPGDPRYLNDLIHCVRYGDCDVGLAFDGDGDRLAVVSKSGNVVWPDRQLILFAREVLQRRPGAQVIYDVKSSRNVAREVRSAGGVPIMWKSGHAFIRAKMQETGALLAGEMSGHVFFRDRWYGFDDAIYAGARLVEILSRSDDPAGALDALPESCSTPELRLDTSGVRAQELIAGLRQHGRFMGAREIIDVDGVRVEYEDGFGLARISNTGPEITLRFEADTGVALSRIQEDFRRQLLSLAPRLRLPF